MVFSSIEFLFFFLPATLAVYFVVPHRARNAVLLVASLIFYAWGGGPFVLLLLGSIAVNYAIGRMIGWAVETDQHHWRVRGVALSVVANLALLSYFKYANFAVEQLTSLGDQFGWEPFAWSGVALPIGISFYTFHSLSYAIDISRGRSMPMRSPIDFALYISLFPQLIAGPIIRFHEIASQFKSRTTRLEDFAQGSLRFTYGLAKKVIIADTLAPVADAAFSSTDDLSAVGAWIGLLAFTFQIYFDFSGYTDMAIGLARMLGFHFPENFRRPYSALSITDFWRRWHITLSTWFRDYLYIPLGGARGSPRRTSFNLLLVFAATGFWHGASWTFLIWGMVHGAVMLWERRRGTRYVEESPHEARARARTFLIVVLAWVLFRAETLGDAVDYFGALVGQRGGFLAGDLVLSTVDVRELVMLIVGLGSLFLPRWFFGGRIVSENAGRAATAARLALFGVALPVALVLIVAGTFSPFLYFQF